MTVSLSNRRPIPDQAHCWPWIGADMHHVRQPASLPRCLLPGDPLGAPGWCRAARPQVKIGEVRRCRCPREGRGSPGMREPHCMRALSQVRPARCAKESRVSLHAFERWPSKINSKIIRFERF